MSKRFGRNQKRAMREQIRAAEGEALHSRRLAAESFREASRIRQSAIIIEPTIYDRYEDRQIELRVKLSRCGREDYFITQRLEQDLLRMKQGRGDFIKMVGEIVGKKLFDALAK